MNSKGKNELKSGFIQQELALIILSLFINNPSMVFDQHCLLLLVTQ